MTLAAADDVLWYLLGAVAVALLVLGTATLALSVRMRLHQLDREEARPGVRRVILEALDPELSLEEVAEELDERDRDVTLEVLEKYLRQLTGEDRERLREVARKLDLDDRALDLLESPLLYRRLEGFNWLTLLDVKLSEDELTEHVGDDPKAAEAAARYLHRDGRDRRATETLLATHQRRLSTFAMDTLYQANSGDPTPILDVSRDSYEGWQTSKTIQVLKVIEHCSESVPQAPVDWISDLSSHSSPEVRAAALRAVRHQGWQTELRESVDWSSVFSDVAVVRRAGYRTLGEWGDASSLRLLSEHGSRETDARCRLAAVQALHENGAPRSHAESEGYTRTWDWVEALSRAG